MNLFQVFKSILNLYSFPQDFSVSRILTMSFSKYLQPFKIVPITFLVFLTPTPALASPQIEGVWWIGGPGTLTLPPAPDYKTTSYNPYNKTCPLPSTYVVTNFNYTQFNSSNSSTSPTQLMSFNLHYPHEFKVETCGGTRSDLMCDIGGVGAAGGQPVGDKAFCGVNCDEGAYIQVDLTGDGLFEVSQSFNCSPVQPV